MKLKYLKLKAKDDQIKIYGRSLKPAATPNYDFDLSSYLNEKAHLTKSEIQLVNPLKKKATILHYNFLGDCEFLQLDDKELIYTSIGRFMRGILGSEKLYDKKINMENIYNYIDGKKGILLLAKLEN